MSNLFFILFVNYLYSMIKLKSLLSEDPTGKISNKRNKEVIRKFGEFLFGDALGQDERDTEIESEYFSKIKNFVIGHFNNTSKSKIVNVLKSLHDIKKDYPDVLVPETNKLYRSTFLSNEQIKSLGEKSSYKTDISIFEKGYVYKAKDIVQSWSANLNAVSQFQEVSLNDYAVDLEEVKPVILYTEIPEDQILFSFEFLNHIAYGTNVEYEIVRVSRQPLKCTVLVNDIIWDSI